MFESMKRRRLVSRVNKALGIDLFDWQIGFIFDDQGIPEQILKERRSGKTTAQILRVLLNPSYNGVAIGGESPENPTGSTLQETPKRIAECVKVARLYGEDGCSQMRRRYFLGELRRIRRILKQNRIKANDMIIIFS